MFFDFIAADRTLTAGAPEHVRIVEQEFRHTIITVRMFDDPSLSRMATGTPILVRWGENQTAIRELPSYVVSVTPHAALARPVLDVTLIGASYPTKQVSQRVFSNTRATQAIATLAAEHGLSTSLDTNEGGIYATLVQGGSSDWEFLVSTARRAGLSLAPVGTHLHARNPEKVLSEMKNSAYLYTPFLHTRRAEWVTANVGQVSGGPDQLRNREAYTIDSTTKTLVRVGSAPASHPVLPTPPSPLLRSFPRITAHSVGDAQTEVDGETGRNRFPFSAEALLEGTAGMHPLLPICFDGFDRNVNGAWMVRRAEHEFTPRHGKYTTTVQLGRNVETDDGYRPPARRNVGGTANPPTRLVGKTWRAAWS